ncbi:MAG: outer membrane beta-barrel domain-containing protein [Pseudomonadota bacterium]
MIALSLLGATSAFSQEIDESAFALQARKYHLKHEFYVAPGLLPLDAFKKSVIANVSYTYHINDGWGVEMAQAAYAYNVDTGLKKNLERLFGATTAAENPLKYFASANVVIKPIYGKMIFFNRTILHGETFFVAGGGPFKFRDGFKATADVGIGFRIFLNDWASLRFDARDYVTVKGFKNILILALGMSFNLGGG